MFAFCGVCGHADEQLFLRRDWTNQPCCQQAGPLSCCIKLTHCERLWVCSQAAPVAERCLVAVPLLHLGDEQETLQQALPVGLVPRVPCMQNMLARTCWSALGVWCTPVHPGMRQAGKQGCSWLMHTNWGPGNGCQRWMQARQVKQPLTVPSHPEVVAGPVEYGAWSIRKLALPPIHVAAVYVTVSTAEGCA